MMKGGKPIRRLDRPFEDRPYLTPALIDVTDAKDRPDEELFGPVLQLIRVKDFDAAIDEANNTRFGLAASLIGGSPELYDRFWANVRAGRDQLEQADQRRPVQRPVRRRRPQRQPPPERLLRRRLLRLSGDQQRSRSRPRQRSAKACAIPIAAKDLRLNAVALATGCATASSAHLRQIVLVGRRR